MSGLAAATSTNPDGFPVTNRDKFLDGVQVALQNVKEALQGCGDLDGVLVRMQCLLWVEPVFSPSVHFSGLLAAVSEMIAGIDTAITEEKVLQNRGRPQLKISETVLSCLLEQEFTQVEIAQILGCCTKTDHRRIAQFGLSNFTEYAKISDAELDALVQEFVSNFPTAGSKTLAGHLSGLGYRIQRWRIRERKSLSCGSMGSGTKESSTPASSEIQSART